MRLIREIEVAYFRSFFKDKLSEVSDFNLIFGRNDSGKSNVLRALNLFFNQQTNPNLPFDFNLDFNHERRTVAASGEDIRKFIYIKITFNTPPNYKSSLGDAFSVKRQWNVSSSQEFHQEISRNVSPRRHQYVTRLLNQIQFHYIPAVKDRKIFSWLFQKIYGIIVSNVNFSEALERFSTEIQTNTEGLFRDLEPILGFKSLLAPPNNLTDLFGALDVDTLAQATGESLSLILQRGDGLQVRHIPEILKFISDNDSKPFHIWGFEEPENSLELAFAHDEARRFVEISTNRNKQLFVTSHSPAFYMVEDSAASKYFIHRANSRSTIKRFKSDEKTSALELMGDNFFLPIISKSMQQAMIEIDALKQSISDLNAEIEATNGPILFVEGESDKVILTTAYAKLFGTALPFVIEASGGTSKMKALCAEGDVLDAAANNRGIFVITDNDFDGRDLAPSSQTGRWLTARNKTKWWLLEPTNEYKAQLAKVQFGDNMHFFCIEDCFGLAFRRVLLAEIPDLASEYKYNAPRNYPIKVEHPKLIRAAEADLDLKLSLFSPTKDAKIAFSNRLENEPPARFEYFRVIFERLNRELSS